MRSTLSWNSSLLENSEHTTCLLLFIVPSVTGHSSYYGVTQIRRGPRQCSCAQVCSRKVLFPRTLDYQQLTWSNGEGNAWNRGQRSMGCLYTTVLMLNNAIKVKTNTRCGQIETWQ